MQGIEASRKFYTDAVKPMIERDFAQYKHRIAVGLVGHGSECFGFDDSVSTDHDFETSLCLWITREDEQTFGFKLFRAYSKLQTQYSAQSRSEKSIGGSDGRGVMTIEEFYKRYTGRNGAPETLEDWLYIPSHYLAEATNGEVFCDELGVFSEVRETIKNGMPEDVRRKKIASCAFYMAQSGQYNYERCLMHGERGAARLALDEFVKNALEISFLLEGAHMPYYKWSFRALRELGQDDIAQRLEKLINAPAENTKSISSEIEQISFDVIQKLVSSGLSDSGDKYLEAHAYSINSRIVDHRLRNMPVML
ncbi:MAG: DUF4037 domain-containing protein [Clostridia bacterium]|nr:DUF4037 domain-containing protein [Clostridia bacterium]